MRTLQKPLTILVFLGLASLLVGNALAQVAPSITFDENGNGSDSQGNKFAFIVGPGPLSPPNPNTLIYSLGPLAVGGIPGDVLIREGTTGAPLSDVVSFFNNGWAAFYSEADTSLGSVTVTTGGSGYTSSPTVTFSGGGGTGAAGHAIIAGGVVTSIVLDAPGSDYSTPPVISLTGGGAGSGATATAILAPFDLADVGLPTQFQLNQLNMEETGLEGNNGVVYIPLAGQPGFVPNFPGLTYRIVSDVPEPSTLILLGMGALGLLAYLWRSRRRAG